MDMMRPTQDSSSSCFRSSKLIGIWLWTKGVARQTASLIYTEHQDLDLERQKLPVLQLTPATDEKDQDLSSVIRHTNPQF
jgi:hypothetical protein